MWEDPRPAEHSKENDKNVLGAPLPAAVFPATAAETWDFLLDLLATAPKDADGIVTAVRQPAQYGIALQISRGDLTDWRRSPPTREELAEIRDELALMRCAASPDDICLSVVCFDQDGVVTAYLDALGEVRGASFLPGVFSFSVGLSTRSEATEDQEPLRAYLDPVRAQARIDRFFTELAASIRGDSSAFDSYWIRFGKDGPTEADRIRWLSRSV